MRPLLMCLAFLTALPVGAAEYSFASHGSPWLTREWNTLDARWQTPVSQPLGFSLDMSSTGIREVGLSWTHEDWRTRVEPMTFRVSLRGFALYENRLGDESGCELFSFDRNRDRDSRKQILMVSLQKRF